ncbi:MAG: hypothetical protein JOZ12_05950 [Sinobacteraceae bacterium]|nr:hypothetical protein [Nevskiaceae bacterium]MBV8855254.1 hypothetical protein [Nevskiaceae bacterium]MBV9914306.1 hypothetical protein [Nevskiaceae bacterium]
MKKLLFSSLLALLAVTGQLTAAAADQAVGTWNLNVAKSKYSPGPVPKAMTRTYTEKGDEMSLTVKGTAADGSAIAQQSTFKYDGKDYPFSGAAHWDALAVKRVNGTTVKSTLKKDGKVVGHSTRSISAHGKVMTLTTKYTDASGAKHDDVAVWDKQ